MLFSRVNGKYQMKKESKLLIFYLILVGTICIVNYLIRIAVHPVQANDPIYYISGSCVVVVFLFGYVLYSWKSNLSEFLKRVCISIPFALIFSVLAKTLGHDIYASLLAGMFISILLLLKTPNWKKHFVAILIPSSVFIILAKFYFTPRLESPEASFATTGLILFGIMLILSFLLLYSFKLLEQDKPPDLKAIMIRSVKFGVAISMFFVVYLVFEDVGDRLELSFPVHLFLNMLLTILFFVICYIFDLFLIERKKRSKRSEIQDELNEFYLKERAKIKSTDK